ncbi:uncharacterized protein PAC_15974 [Phialocephala subalpina]|uniref:Centromere protein X n=1 Tax=Phialocephala subalpina TaxID=576137 RepID=A0A1L7XM27_9HELO|nr:uncharacterized protein PAC_15974 [Phialocephala subalpina]
MPPKPFNPPRPRTSTSSNNNDSSKPRGRPKGATSTSSKPTKPTKSTSTKSAKDPKRIPSAKFGGLPSLSPETRRELEGTTDEEGAGSDVEMLDNSKIGGQSEVEEEDDDPFASQPLPKNKKTTTSKPSKPINLDSDRSDHEAEDDDKEGDNERREKIPDDLLNVLLHQFFKQEGTRMHKDANRAVGKYMEIFVREGIARAVWGREEAGGGGGLEVEDLEKLAPQLILDF